MSIFKLSWKNLLAKPLNTGLSLLLLMFGVGTISLLFLLNYQLDEQLKNNVRGVGLVIGANGSPTQIMLSAIYQIGSPTGNIHYDEVARFAQHPAVQYAIPLSYGDGYQSYRVMGTSHDYLKLYDARLANGKLWREPMEVVLGDKVARETGLQIGDSLSIGHALEHHHDHPLRVVGILAPDYSVVDQLILTDTRTLPAVHGHAETHTDSTGAEVHTEAGANDITALLLSFKEGQEGMSLLLAGMVNQNPRLKAVLPAAELSYINKQMGVGVGTFRAFALVIMVVSGLSVFISLYNSLKERRYEMALLRSLGASPAYLLWSVLLEGMILAVIGFALGLVASRAAMWLLSRVLTEQYHYDFGAGFFLWQEEGTLGLLTLGIGMLAAIIPAIQAYNTSIAKTMADA